VIRLRLEDILRRVQRGEISIEEAIKQIRLFAIETLGNDVRFDLGRELRRDVPEIIYAETKENDVLLQLVEKTVRRVGRVIISRLRDDQIGALESLRERYVVKLSKAGHIASVKQKGYTQAKYEGNVGIVTGGTADIMIAEEAGFIVKELGCKVIKLYDVGIAGIQRTLEAVKRLMREDVDVVIVIAGMEGALPSVMASLLNVPIIGVPTSVGYGLGGRGYAALLSMLQACPLGVAVVNIDNGVNAGVIAALIARRVGMYRSMAKEKRTSMSTP